MEIIDTHQHLWDLDQLPYSWTSRQPALNRSFRPSDYHEATRDLTVAKSVHVEADVDEDFMLEETLHVISLARRDDNPIAGVVAAARPEYDDFREYLDRIAGQRLLKGVRRILHTEPDRLSTTTTFVENVRSLEDYGLTFDICASARQLPQAINLVEQCPDVRVHPRPLRQPESAFRRLGRRVRRVARTFAGDRRFPERCLQDFRHRGQRRSDELDRRDIAAGGRDRDRLFRMGSRDVRQRLAGLHSGGEFQAVGGSVVDPDARRRRRKPAKAILRERHAGLSPGPKLKKSATNEHQYSRMMAGGGKSYGRPDRKRDLCSLVFIRG